MNADKHTLKAVVAPELVDIASEVLRMLADPTRIRIVLALKAAEELSVNALAELVEKKPSGVSQHLSKLRLARIVTTRQQGTSVLYRLTDNHALTLITEALNQAEHAVAGGQSPPHHHAPEAS